MYHLKSVALISLPKEKLNLIVRIKVIANSQLKKPLTPHPRSHSSPSPQLSWPLQGAHVLGKKGSGQ